MDPLDGYNLALPRLTAVVVATLVGAFAGPVGAIGLGVVVAALMAKDSKRRG